MPVRIRPVMAWFVASLALCATARSRRSDGDSEQGYPPMALVRRSVPSASRNRRLVPCSVLTLKGLPPGLHGLHLHDKGDCGPGIVNGNAGGRRRGWWTWDSEHAGKHAGPEGEGTSAICRCSRFLATGPSPRASLRHESKISKPCAATL